MIPEAPVSLLILAPLWPLVLAASLLSHRMRGATQRFVWTGAVPALLLALLPSSGSELELPWLLLGVVLGVDEISRTFLLFSAILWTAGALTLRPTGDGRLTAWFLVTMAGNFALLLAQDIPFFFLSYALMSLASFGLVIHRRTAAARRAARIYLIFAVLGEMILLAALAMVAHNAATLQLESLVDRSPQSPVILLLLLGFGIKTGIPLLHFALPLVYRNTPLAAMAPVAGALLHLGLYGWLRFLPLGQVSSLPWSGIFVSIGAIAVLYGIGVGLLQREARPLLAYSSISQAGLMVLGLGIAFAAPESWPVLEAILTLFALHHALAKGALFYGLGVRGRARLALWLPALALVGLPMTGGALAKGQLKLHLELLPDPWSQLAVGFVVFGSIGSMLLMLRFMTLARIPDETTQMHGAWTWYLLITAMLLLPWFWPIPVERMSPVFWSALWPALLGGMLAWLVWRGPLSRYATRLPAIPAGDLLVTVERLISRLSRSHQASTHHAPVHPEAAPASQPQGLLLRLERLTAHWQMAIGCLLVIIAVIFVLAAV